jgi:hypothetical protein
LPATRRSHTWRAAETRVMRRIFILKERESNRGERTHTEQIHNM